MRVIIAGSRGIEDYGEVCRAMMVSGFKVTEVVSGKARGVDLLPGQLDQAWEAGGVHSEYRDGEVRRCRRDLLGWGIARNPVHDRDHEATGQAALHSHGKTQVSKSGQQGES